MKQNITVTEISEVFTVNSPKGRTDTVVNRSKFGLSFCTDGQITYIHNGKRVISDRNHAVILPKGKTYRLYGNKTGAFAVINFDCNVPICDTIVQIKMSNAENYMSNFEKMKYLSLFENTNYKIISIFYHILHKLNYQSSPCRTILPAIKYIENNYFDPTVSNDVLAKQCNISEIYFRKLFATHYKITPKQYIINLRINKAKQLLSEGNLKVTAIAKQCGFTNQYHFDRQFKQKTGITPSEYIKQNLIVTI